MAQDRHIDFLTHLQNRGISLDLLEQGSSLIGQSLKSPDRSFRVDQVPNGFVAVQIATDGVRTELYKGPRQDEAALACLCAEAQAQGIQKSWFKNAGTKISLNPTVPAPKGSVFEDPHGNQIECHGAYPNRKYLCYDQNRHPLRSFSDARLAAAYMSVIADSDTNPVLSDVATKDPLFKPELRKFTLEITQMPHIVRSPDGSTSMVLVGQERQTDGVKEHRLPFRGDRAKGLEIVLKARRIDANNPVLIDVETELKVRRIISQNGGNMRSSMIREITTAHVQPGHARTVKADDLVA